MNRMAQRELNRFVQNAQVVLRAVNRDRRIDDAPLRRQVETHREPIGGEQLLPGHREKLATQIDAGHRLATRPRPADQLVPPRPERLDIAPLFVQQSGLPLGDHDFLHSPHHLLSPFFQDSKCPAMRLRSSAVSLRSKFSPKARREAPHCRTFTVLALDWKTLQRFAARRRGFSLERPGRKAERAVLEDPESQVSGSNRIALQAYPLVDTKIFRLRELARSERGTLSANSPRRRSRGASTVSRKKGRTLKMGESRSHTAYGAPRRRLCAGRSSRRRARAFDGGEVRARRAPTANRSGQ